MPPKKKKGRKQKPDNVPPELYITAQIQQETPEGISTVPLRVRKPAEGEIFAIVLKTLGDNRVRVQCADGRTRVARIKGVMRKRKWIRVGDAVLVEPWYGLDEERKADVKHRYRPNEKRVLESRGMLKELEDFL
ncbi:MAG: translation initiation factor eIF-1A [Candidatus Hermodarchaeota archaeon]